MKWLRNQSRTPIWMDLAILLLLVLLAACAPPPDSPAAEQATATAPPTAPMTEATATATPLPTPDASMTPAPTSQTYLWPAALPEPLAIVSGESYADPTGFGLTLTDATGGQLRAQIGGGAHAQFTGDPRPGAQPVTIRGQAGYKFTTGAGWSLYWVEDDTPYSIIGGLPRDMAFAVADGLEPVDLTTWQQRLTTVSTPTITPAAGLTYFWPGWLPEGWVIQPTTSFADSTGFVLDIAHSDEPLTFATISGGSSVAVPLLCLNLPILYGPCSADTTAMIHAMKYRHRI